MDKNYFKVPNDVFTAGLNKYELLVLIYLCRCQNNKEFAFPSYETIAKCCCISRRKAITTVKNLVHRGFLLKQVRPSNYRRNYPNLYQVVLQKFNSAYSASGSARRAPKKELVNKNYKDTIFYL